MSKTMPTTVVGHNVEGVCSISGKKGEVFLVRVGNGEVQAVQSSKLLEILRWNCSIKAPSEGSSASSN